MKSIFAGSMAVLIAGTALAPAAMASPGERGRNAGNMGSQFFSTFDADSDGAVTAAEIETKRNGEFAKADSSGDGTITLEEWKVFAADKSNSRGQDRSIRIFQRFDTDGDGQVTRDEFLNQAERMTARMDRMQERKGERPAKMKDGKPGKGGWDEGRREGRQGKGGHHGMRDGGPRGHGMMGQMMAQVDLDRDGKVSKGELNTLADKIFTNGPVDLAGFQKITAQFKEPLYVKSFQRLDADGNLTVTQEEFFTPTADMMKRMDRNKDGVITKADFQKMKRGWHKGPKDGKGSRDGQGDRG
ncbi:EF-hand domain-containing protein [Pseudovibrio axinellae]|nr:EF-hand domain-containing protein [Pseudovibrio axinellae]